MGLRDPAAGDSLIRRNGADPPRGPSVGGTAEYARRSSTGVDATTVSKSRPPVRHGAKTGQRGVRDVAEALLPPAVVVLPEGADRALRERHAVRARPRRSRGRGLER